jgi:hypothetical protein
LDSLLSTLFIGHVKEGTDEGAVDVVGAWEVVGSLQGSEEGILLGALEVVGALEGTEEGT